MRFWWTHALRPVTVGLVIGVVLVFAIGQLTTLTDQLLVVLGLCLVMIVGCALMLVDLRKDQREAQARLAEFEQMIKDRGWDG